MRRSRHAVAALDQIALSVFSLALNLVLVRVLSATDFGIVSLWLSVSLLTVGVQNALVNGPQSIYLPAARDAAAAQRLEAALTLVNLVTIAGTTAGVAAVDLFVDAEWARHDLATGLAIPLFVAFTMFREYYRSVAFSRRDMTMLLWTDLPYLVTIVAVPGRDGLVAGTGSGRWPGRFWRCRSAAYGQPALPAAAAARGRAQTAPPRRARTVPRDRRRGVVVLGRRRRQPHRDPQLHLYRDQHDRPRRPGGDQHRRRAVPADHRAVVGLGETGAAAAVALAGAPRDRGVRPDARLGPRRDHDRQHPVVPGAPRLLAAGRALCPRRQISGGGGAPAAPGRPHPRHRRCAMSSAYPSTAARQFAFWRTSSSSAARSPRRRRSR